MLSVRSQAAHYVSGFFEMQGYPPAKSMAADYCVDYDYGDYAWNGLIGDIQSMQPFANMKQSRERQNRHQAMSERVNVR